MSIKGISGTTVQNGEVTYRDGRASSYYRPTTDGQFDSYRTNSLLQASGNISGRFNNYVYYSTHSGNAVN